MKYQPDQSILDYSDWDLATSSVITGDFTTDSLKYGFGPTSLSAESSDEAKLREYERTYGKEQAKIRMRLKKSIMKRKTHGTKAGQWSARKSQLLKEEYEAACERAGLKPYKGSKTESQKNLSDWSDQDWRTASGGKSSKTGEPYFPAKAVAALKEKGLYAKAKRQKAAATKAGKQHADYSEDIEAVVKKYRSEAAEKSVEAKEPWVTGERPKAAVQSEIVAGYHDDAYGDLGCPRCRNIDYFWKTTTSKGKKYRCMMCEYTDDYETVKSQGDITLEKFGLTVECPICEESISAYNQDSIRYHLKKHEPKVSEAEENYDSKLFSSIVKDIWNRFSVMRRAWKREEYLQREIREPIRLNFGYGGRNKEANDRYFQAITIEDTDLRYYIDNEWDDGPVEFNRLTQESLKRVEDLQNDLRTKYNNPSIKLEVHDNTTVNIEGSGVFVVEISMNANTESFEAENGESDDYALIVGDLSDTEQLSLEIEDIDETYGLINLSEIETSVQDFAVNAASEMMEDYSDIIPCVAIVFVSETFSLDHVARYRSQTVGNCPIVMLSLSAIKDSAFEYDVSLNLAVATSVWHELGHALDEYCYDYLNFDVVKDDDPEEFAESFARWYSGFSSLAPPTQEQIFELSEG
jgi:hypothetical protein